MMSVKDTVREIRKTVEEIKKEGEEVRRELQELAHSLKITPIRSILWDEVRRRRPIIRIQRMIRNE